MSTSNTESIYALYSRALELPGEARNALLEEARYGDPKARALIERMLAASEETDEWLRPGGALWGALWAYQSALPATVEPPVGSRVGAFQVVRILGRGGMATVYLAERADGEFEQKVALKVLRRTHRFDINRSRFEQERQILADLNHPNLARLIDGGTTGDGLPYVAMELVDGDRIDHYCETRGMGLAAPATLDGPHPMTPEFASPEQLRGEVVTAAADVYQLGHLLFLLVSGSSPYVVARKNFAGLVAAICSRPPRRLREATSNVASKWPGPSLSDLETICTKALDKDPDRRFPSARALLHDIDRLLTGEPIVAKGPEFGCRASKALAKNSVALSAIGAILILLLGLYGTLLLREERDLARIEAQTANRTADFLVRLFELANPRNTAPNDPPRTALQLAEQGAKIVRQELADEPGVQAAMHEVLGRVFMNLGKPDRAEALFRASVTTRDRSLAPLHREPDGATHRLAAVPRVNVKWRKATSTHSTVLEICRRPLDQPPGPGPYGVSSRALLRPRLDALTVEAAQAKAGQTLQEE